MSNDTAIITKKHTQTKGFLKRQTIIDKTGQKTVKS